MKTVFVAILFIFSGSLISQVFGQTEKELGIINDLIPDGIKQYYFEVEKNDRSTTWTENTKIKIFDGKTAYDLSEKMFMYPTELQQDREYLYFAALSEDCKGQITCDYQDLYQMAKNDGSMSILAKHLKSSIHVSVERDFVYVSESNGNIWQISKNNNSKKLLIKANEIVMDIATNGDKIYWIEELSDQNNNILTLKDSKPTTIAKDLKIPYDLTVQKNTLYWNEIRVEQEQNSFVETTAIKSYESIESTLMEFQNTSPISIALNEVHYKPYLVFDDYLFLVNNTETNSVIHMINLHNSTKYDIGVISDYEAKYLRTDGKSLFVIGANQEGFVIDRHTLPIVVPEFPNSILAILPIALVSTVILTRFWHKSAH